MNQNSDGSGGPVLVVGATGDVGGEVVRLLVEAGAEVLALHRRPEQAAALADLGAEPVLARLDGASAMRRVMGRAERLFLLTPPLPTQVDLERHLVQSAEDVHLGHVVRISASDSNPRSPVPWARAHAWADRRLAGTDLAWTSLRPSAFMQNLAQQAVAVRRGVLPHTAGGGGVAWVDTRDVAGVVARVLLDGPRAHDRATYFLTGPESLTFHDVAGRLTTGLGRRVRAVPLPKQVYVTLLRAAGVDAFTAAGLGAQFADVVRHNVDTDVTSDVARLVGRPPRTVEQWVEDHHDLF